MELLKYAIETAALWLLALAAFVAQIILTVAACAALGAVCYKIVETTVHWILGG